MECQHNSLSIRHEGPLEIYICRNAECALIVSAKCEHSVGTYPNQENLCVWDDAGEHLTCSYCGKDVT